MGDGPTLIDSLFSVHRELVSPKISKRKDSLRQLLLYLKNESIQRYLAGCSRVPVPLKRNFDQEPPEEMSWDRIVLQVIEMVEIEVKHAGKRVEKSFTAPSSRSQSALFRPDILRALKDVLAAADRDSATKIWWSVPKAFHHVVAILSDDFTCAHFWGEYSKLVVDKFLGFAPYHSIIRVSDVGDLMSRCFKHLYSPKDPNAKQSGKILRALTSCLPLPSSDLRVDENRLEMLVWFCEAFKNYEIESDSYILSSILISINNLLLELGINNCDGSRKMTLRLQDQLLRRFIPTRNEHMKEEMVLFFRIQMKLFLSETGGIMAIAPPEADQPEVVERGFLEKLFERVLKRYWESPDHQLQSAHGNRVIPHNTFSLSKKSLSLLDLGADILFRINRFAPSSHPDGCSSFSVSTSPVSESHKKSGNKRLSEGPLSHGPPSKRSRREFSRETIWIPLTKQIESFVSVDSPSISEAHSHRLTHTMHLFVVTLRKYPSILSRSQHHDFLEKFVEVLQIGSDRFELETWTMLCLLELASSSSQKTTQTSQTSFLDSASLWRRLWFLVCRRLSQKSQVTEVALRLMKEMVDRGLVETQDLCQDEIWKHSLFDPNSTSLESFERHSYCAAVKFVFSFLSHFQLQATNVSLHDSGMGGDADSNQSLISTRERLLRWLLSSFRASSCPAKLKISTLERIDADSHQKVFGFASRLEEASWVASTLLGCVRGGTLHLYTAPSSSLIREHILPQSISSQLSGLISELSLSFENRTQAELEGVEKRLQYLVDNRTAFLSSSDTKPSSSLPRETSTNQVPPKLKSALLLSTSTLLSGQIDALLEEASKITSDRFLTVGINTSKLAGKLIELLHHCHLVTILILEMRSSQGCQQLSSSLRTALHGVCEFVASHLEKCRGDKPKMGLLLKEMCAFATLWKDCDSIAPLIRPLFISAVEVLGNSGSMSQKKSKTHEVIDLDLDFGEVEDATPQKDNEEEILMSCVEFVATGAQDQEISQLDLDLPSKLRSFSKSSAFQSFPLSLRLQWHICNLEVCGSLGAVEMALTFLMNLFENGIEDMRFFLPITYCKMIGLVSFAGRLLPRASLPFSQSSSSPIPSDRAIETCETVINIFISEFKENRLNWAHRLCLSDCLAVFIETGPSYTRSNEPCESLMHWENVFLHLIRDHDFRVRHFMSKSISILFSLYENTEALYLDVERRLGVAEKQEPGESSQESHTSLVNQTEEELKTVLLTLAEILCSCDVNEERILLIFATIASINPRTNQTVVLLLDEVAKRSRFPSRLEFLRNSFSQIVSLWIGGTNVHSPRSIFQFPWNLLEEEPTGVSLASYVDVLLPQLLFFFEEDTLFELSKKLNTNLPQLLKKHFSIILAHLHPLKYVKANSHEMTAIERFEKIWNLVKRHVHEQERNNQISKELDGILIGLLDLLTHGDSKQVPPNGYEREPISRTIRYMMKLFGRKTEGALLLSEKSNNKDRVQKIILHFNEKLSRNCRPSSQLMTLETVRYLIELMKELLHQAWAFRDLLYLFLRMIQRDSKIALADKRDEVVTNCCDQIFGLCESVFQAGECQELSRQLPAIVATLVPVAERDGTSSSIAALKVIQYLVVTRHKELGDAICDLYPFPSHPKWSVIGSAHQEARGEVSLLHEIKMCIGLRSQLTDYALATRQALMHFAEQIRTRKKELLSLLFPASSEGMPGVNREDETIADNWKLLTTLQWELIQMCSNESVRHAATLCLALLGPIDANIVAFSSESSTFSAHLPGAIATEDETLSFRANVLSFLTKLIVDVDTDVVAVASKTLKTILCQGVGRDAFGVLSEFDKNYLFPFNVTEGKAKLNRDSLLRVGKTRLVEFGELQHAELWSSEFWTTRGKSYSSWIRLVAFRLTAISSDPVLSSVAVMCLLKVEFASFVFPFVIQDILSTKHGDSLVQFLMECILKKDNVEIVLQILGCFQFLRGEKIRRDRNIMEKFTSGGNTTSRSKSRSTTLSLSLLCDMSPWNSMNLLDLASAAQHSNAFLTSLMYLELWHEWTFHQVTLVDQSLYDTHEDGGTFISLLQNVFQNINEPDGIHGLSEASRGLMDVVRVYEHEGAHSKAMVLYNTMLQHPSSGSLRMACQSGLLSALQHTGQYYLTQKLLSGIGHESPDDFSGVCEYQYEVAWRLSDWQSPPMYSQLFEEDRPNSSPTPFHEGAFRCLRAIHENDALSFSKAEKAVWDCLGKELGRSTVESTKNVYPMFAKLHFVERLRQMSLIKQGSIDSQPPPTYDTFCGDWKQSLALMRNNDFESMDILLELKSNASLLMGHHESQPSHLLQMATLARKSGQLERATQILYRVKSATGNEDLSSLKGVMELSRILWKQQDWRQAIREVTKLIGRLKGGGGGSDQKKPRRSGSNRSSLEKSIDPLSDEHGVLLSEAVCSLGKWMADTRLGSPNSIIDGHLEEALKYAIKFGGDSTKMFFTLAKYADLFYQGLKERLSSSEWIASQHLRDQHKEQLLKMKTASKNDSLPRNVREACMKRASALSRQLDIDEAECKMMRKEMETLLQTAIKNYMFCLREGERYNVRAVFRLCSLWFSNTKNLNINRLIKCNLGSISTFKFLPLAYQIVSRISGEEQALFCKVLWGLIYQIAKNHPHHILWHLLALTKGGKTTYKGASSANQNLISDAKVLFDKMVQKDVLRPVAEGMQDLAAAYEELADLEISKREVTGDKKKLTPKLSRIRDLSTVALPTVDLAVRPEADYSSIVYPQKYIPTFNLVGGIHLPKLVTCLGSDGRYYRQLVKSKDDLRQDAVMQQIFLLVNALLRQNHPTRVRNLCIRTYHVVPLTPCSGLLEWVEDTTSLQSYLVGGRNNFLISAHKRYRPKDYLNTQCREKLSNAKGEKDKIRTYKNITDNFKPVFHHYFLENFSDPATWFAKRLTYTRSAACNSMVGYIVGLGDRHVDNILLDKKSCDIIQIDLGIAFEQGKTLRVPELVPFRLSRDMVDGMGITGVEGAFRGCCEETMKVLRANKEYVLTIVEVFVHDPLFRSLSPMVALQAQRNEEDEEEGVDMDEMLSDETRESHGDDLQNKDAERTLLRIKSKLQGCEYGETLSVEGQVIHLINEAQDPNKLALMYPGWSPWV